jgi:hypothetical protein
MGTFDRMARILIAASFITGVSLMVGAQIHVML